MRIFQRRLAAAAVAAALTTTALVGCSEPEPETEATETTSVTAERCMGDGMLECARNSTLADLVPAEPTEADGEPIRLGMVNQENTPAGSYPELSQAVAAAVEFVNTQMGGVDGRPIEVEVCNTNFSAEGSTACGQQFAEDATPAVLGGIDVFGNSIDVLDENAIPFIGGIPISTQSAESTNSFQWSGGTWGAAVAFADHAVTEAGAETVSILYGDFGSVAHSAEMAQEVLETRGAEVQMIPYPIMATDISSALNAAATYQPDALFVMAADSGCQAGFDGVDALGIDAALYFVGACAAPTIIDEVGVEKSEGAMFNVEGFIGAENQPNDDSGLYNAVIDTYGDGLDPVGAGTVTFRSFMNLYVILSSLDEITPEAITGALAAQVDAPSFMGHDYTCDREQFEGLPSLCSPQQILGRMEDGTLVQATDWIDVGAIYAG